MTAIALFSWPVIGIARMNWPPGFADALKRRAPVILVLGLTLAAMDLLRVSPLYSEIGLSVILWGMVTVTLQYLTSCLLVVAAITFAERTGFGASHRMAASVLAVLVAAPIATGLCAWMSSVGAGLGWLLMSAPNFMALYLYLMWYSLVVGMLAAAYFMIWERAEQSATDLRRAQVERQGVKQRMVESRLNVMKARVDPDFLFRMIGDVQRLYRSDVDAAEQRLEDFIEYLRAALPQMRGGATTLGEEVRLAAAYVRLHDEAFEGRLEATFDVDETLDDAQFPPMALLPLVDDALRRASALPNPRLVLHISATDEGSSLAVSVHDDCSHARPTSEGESALVSHERAFIQFFGEGARVRRTTNPDTRVLLEIDHAIAPRAHR
jgi:hypothetical protein